MTETRKLRVFLCHSSQDKPIVRELYQRLIAEGWIDPWLDEENLLPGMNWDMKIEKAVEAADAVIVCLSNGLITEEGNVQRELRKALDIALKKPEGTIFIIPLRLDDCEIPMKLRIWQYIDYYPAGNKKRCFELLLQSIKARGMKTNNKDFANLGGNENAILTIGGIEFVKISAGEYFVSRLRQKALPLRKGFWKELQDEYEQYNSSIPYDYWIGRLPVTNAQFAVFARATNRQDEIPSQPDQQPVEVSREQVNLFFTWFSSTFSNLIPESYMFRVPFEPEWEKAIQDKKLIHTNKFEWTNSNEISSTFANLKMDIFYYSIARGVDEKQRRLVGLPLSMNKKNILSYFLSSYPKLFFYKWFIEKHYSFRLVIVPKYSSAIDLKKPK